MRNEGVRNEGVRASPRKQTLPAATLPHFHTSTLPHSLTTSLPHSLTPSLPHYPDSLATPTTRNHAEFSKLSPRSDIRLSNHRQYHQWFLKCANRAFQRTFPPVSDKFGSNSRAGASGSEYDFTSGIPPGTLCGPLLPAKPHSHIEISACLITPASIPWTSLTCDNV